MLGIRSGKLFIGDLRSRHIWCPGHGGDLVLTEEAFNVQMDPKEPASDHSHRPRQGAHW